MGYHFILFALRAPLTIDHAIVALSEVPDSGFHVHQTTWNEAKKLVLSGESRSLTADEVEACEGADLPRRARFARAEQAVKEASIAGDLHRSIVANADGNTAILGHLQSDPEQQIHQLAPRLDLGDCLAFQGDFGPLWAFSWTLRILGFDDADLIAAEVSKARAFADSRADARVPGAQAVGIPDEEAIRAFVSEHAGEPCLLLKG